MTRISRIGNTGAPGGAAKTKASSGVFSAAQAAPSDAAGGPARAPAASTLGALIALQGENHSGAKNGNRKTFAAAQQVLQDLERLQHAMLDGASGAQAVESLEKAATLRAHAGADAKLIGLYDEIALRARVELAKLGR